jgi:hypothetical protein
MSRASVCIKPVLINPFLVGWLLSPYVGASSRVSGSSSLFRLFITLGGGVGGGGGGCSLARCKLSTRSLKSLLFDDCDEKLSCRSLNECGFGGETGVIEGDSVSITSCLDGDRSSRTTCTLPSGNLSVSRIGCAVFLGDLGGPFLSPRLLSFSGVFEDGVLPCSRPKLY